MSETCRGPPIAKHRLTLSGGQTEDDSCFRPLLPPKAVALQGEDAGEDEADVERGVVGGRDISSHLSDH